MLIARLYSIFGKIGSYVTSVKKLTSTQFHKGCAWYFGTMSWWLTCWIWMDILGGYGGSTSFEQWGNCCRKVWYTLLFSSCTPTDILSAIAPGQKVLISANRFLTSKRNTWVISLNILKRSTVSLILTSSSPKLIILIIFLTAEATRLERALTKPLETDDDLSLEPELELLEPTPNEPGDIAPGAPAPKKKQPAKRKSYSKTTTEGMYSHYFVSWSLAQYLISCWQTKDLNFQRLGDGPKCCPHRFNNTPHIEYNRQFHHIPLSCWWLPLIRRWKQCVPPGRLTPRKQYVSGGAIQRSDHNGYCGIKRSQLVGSGHQSAVRNV